MSDDLIGRLRAAYTAWNNPPSAGLPDCAGVVLEAAEALSVIRAELERKTRRIAELMARNVSEIGAAEAELERVKKALEPFAKWSEKMDTFYADHADDVIAAGNHGTFVTFGNLRAAARALAEETK